MTSGEGPEGRAPPEQPSDWRRRLPRALLVLAAVGVFLALSHDWPRDQTIHVILGDASPRVVEVRVTYGSQGEEEARGATFSYAKGSAPRIVTHEPRLPNGDYTIQIDLGTGEAKDQHVTVARRVSLSGGSLSIDVSRNVP